jgi:signal transduction histidine kinase
MLRLESAGAGIARSTRLRADDERRARAIQLGTLGMFTIGIPTAFRYWALGVPSLTGALLITMAACGANLVWLRRSGRTRRAGNLAIGLYCTLLLLSLSSTGGFYDPNFAWLYTIPVAAAYLLGLGSSWAWTAVAMVSTVVFWLLPSYGIVVPNLVPAESMEAQALFNRLTAIAGLAVLSTSFVVSQRNADRELEESHRDLAREAACVKLLQHAAVAANEARTFESALEGFARRAMETSGWHVAHVWSLAVDGSGDLVSGPVWLDDDSVHYAPLRRLTLETRLGPGDNALRRVVESGRPVWATEGRIATSDSPRGRCAAELGLRSVVAIPVPSADEVVAILEFFGGDATPIDERMIRVLADTGLQVGRVAERIELEERIRQSQKLESVGQLAAGIAHEINNPMAYVRSNLGALRREWGALTADAEKAGWPDPLTANLGECEELIDESLEGVDRAIAIVREVREFSRASDTRFERFDLSELIDGALRVAEVQRPAGIVVERAYAPIEPISCIASQLGQVILNLVVNAFQAMGETGTLQVTTKDLGSRAAIRIEDDGPGIDPVARERIFDPFFTTKAVGEGTGLGLYISYEIVRAHGGEIRVESKPGHGARFEVLLPIVAPDPESLGA